MIKLKFHSNLDASALAVQASAAQNLLPEIQQDPMAGWLDLPETYDHDELTRIKHVARRIQNNSDYLVCIGIGGSYLGHRAIIEALQTTLQSSTKVLYAGNSLSTIAIQQISDEIGDKDFSINVISKSGTTTEPAVAFRIFKQKLIEKYGEDEAYTRIVATTDASRGALHDEALHNHYETFTIPDNIGGRYSVLTPVGLLPLAVAGVDIDELLAGANEEYAATKISALQATETTGTAESQISASQVFEYAAARHILRSRDFDTEVLTCFEPCMSYVSEWWKQLFGESEGKENGGIFPASTIYTTDLHSLGQFLQQGRPNMFETFLTFAEAPMPRFIKSRQIIEVPSAKDNLDGLQYLEGRELTEINKKAELATITAHADHLPVFELELPDLSARSLGGLIYFFELSCAISAKLQGVNPFDQPGVEKYKSEMFRLLGKPE